MGWQNLSEEDKQRVIGLEVELATNEDFRTWMITEWFALYTDIIKETGLYPYFYDKIEEYYEESR